MDRLRASRWDDNQTTERGRVRENRGEEERVGRRRRKKKAYSGRQPAQAFASESAGNARTLTGRIVADLGRERVYQGKEGDTERKGEGEMVDDNKGRR